VTKVRERSAINKKRLQRFHMDRFNLKKLNETESKVSNMVTALENRMLGKLLERISKFQPKRV
jgi:hypothetical protein